VRSQAGAIYLRDEAAGKLHLAVQQGLPSDRAIPLESLPFDKNLGDLTPFSSLLGTGVSLPMRAREGVVGLLFVLQEEGQPPFTEEEKALLTSLADQVGVVVESHRLRQRAEQAAVLEERQRLARDLHDSVTQSLYSVTLLAETSRLAAQAGDLKTVEDCQSRQGQVTQQALKELRLLIYELRPPMLEQEGLVGALQQRLDTVENRAGVEARLRVDGEVELAAPVEEALYRIALESLNNALKHAAAPAVTVRIRADGEEVELEVADNGRGFDPHTANGRGGMGLVTMRERAERVGGVLTIQSAPGEGTQVKVRFSNA
jgi:signal transduction histidine kinase